MQENYWYCFIIFSRFSANAQMDHIGLWTKPWSSLYVLIRKILHIITLYYDLINSFRGKFEYFEAFAGLQNCQLNKRKITKKEQRSIKKFKNVSI